MVTALEKLRDSSNFSINLQLEEDITSACWMSDISVLKSDIQQADIGHSTSPSQKACRGGY